MADVVELILADHRRFEEMFRELRDRTSNRATVLGELAAVLVAHAEAEEAEVYPALKRYSAVENEEVDHGAEEHHEGNEKLLALMEVADTSSEEWEAKLEELVKATNHHLDEEERTILNDARSEVPAERKDELGKAFWEARNRRLDQRCGEIEYVRKLVSKHGS
ncbi:hemerythrin domain-containing protein [Lentzea tibetensis]|uniref:Hemerythrin domain-containing protein n=1 Tax=Lentzea tibetensis TaxID=2591470 RepID=A0A563EYQ9_9PSEU|nr:hemerythrin domain-containing protein [Lentzea tibetensis]TWP52611.1 hemerythrin domain-containing protein [Lentzea tibetensis]